MLIHFLWRGYEILISLFIFLCLCSLFTLVKQLVQAVKNLEIATSIGLEDVSRNLYNVSPRNRVIRPDSQG